MNLDFSNQPTFSWYVVFLLLSGLAMLVVGAIGGGQGAGARALSAVPANTAPAASARHWPPCRPSSQPDRSRRGKR